MHGPQPGKRKERLVAEITDRSFCAGEGFYDFKVNEEGIEPGVYLLHHFWSADHGGGLGKLCVILVLGMGLQGFHSFKLGSGGIICLCDQQILGIPQLYLKALLFMEGIRFFCGVQGGHRRAYHAGHDPDGGWIPLE